MPTNNLIPTTDCTYITDIELDTGETLEVWRAPSGGVFGVDATYLDQVSTTVYEPFEGTYTKLIIKE